MVPMSLLTRCAAALHSAVSPSSSLIWRGIPVLSRLEESTAHRGLRIGRRAAPSLAQSAARLPPVGRQKRPGRYAKQLQLLRPDLFERMRVILGYYDLPSSAGKVPPKINQVTISALQPLQYLNPAAFPPEFCRRLVGYRIAGLNQELVGHMRRTQAFLQKQQSGEASDLDMTFRIPGGRS